MPLLEIIQTRQVTASIRLDEPTAALIDQYAAFLHASADEVVDKALCYVFAKDRDFQDFLRTPQPLMPRRAFASAACRRTGPPRSPPTALRNPAILWRPAMVRPRAVSRMGARIPFGAAHRVYFDTPPLKGCCRAPLGAIGHCVEFVRLTKLVVPLGAHRRSLALSDYHGIRG
jgi:hypothetical protein